MFLDGPIKRSTENNIFFNPPIFIHKIIYLTERMVFPRHFLNDSRLVRMAYGLPGPWIYGYPLKHLLDGG